ncbi:RNA polymerase sigma factor [Planctomycetota bacterium]
MAETINLANFDSLVMRARTEAEALGQLYEVYYPRVYRFCVYRLFDRGAAEDVTSTVFLQVAGRISTFKGRTEAEFRNWIYTIAANHTNAYIRKTSQRKQLFAKATASLAIDNDNPGSGEETSWPMLYQAILKLKPKHQTIIAVTYPADLLFC